MKKSGDVLVMAMRSFLVDLPSPSSISYMWNFGSMLAFCLGLQILTGVFLAMHYTADVGLAFFSVVHLNRDVMFGWMMHYFHANGASFFFICLYLHIGRGVYYSSYSLVHVWGSGVMILFLVMMTAFLGYVLPWGQMSFWGATVITNLLSAVPYWGVVLVEWLWGGFSVGNPTLVRFFAFHYLMPFVLVGLVMVHLVYLHETGSSMPLGLSSDVLKSEFHPYYSLSDLFGLFFLLMMFFLVSLFFPNVFGDSDNFILANPMSTPIHIQPEWYFLFAYAILRSIPNSLGGVVGLVMSILVLFLMVIFVGEMSFLGWGLLWSFVFWWLVVVFILLTWIGARPVEDPYVIFGQVLTFVYFFLFFIMGLLSKI